MMGALRRLVTPAGFISVAAPRPCERKTVGPHVARQEFFEAVEAVAVEERLPIHVAMTKLRTERPDLAAAAYPSSRSFRSSPKERKLLPA